MSLMWVAPAPFDAEGSCRVGSEDLTIGPHRQMCERRTFNLLAKARQDLSGRGRYPGRRDRASRAGRRPMFYELMRRRGPFCFYAFDLLWLTLVACGKLP